MSYLLFYSNHCKYSRQFISILERSNHSVYFYKICVDRDNNKRIRHPLVFKCNITEVPTIIVDDNKYIGMRAFEWLSRKIKNSQGQKAMSIDTRKNKENLNSMKNLYEGKNFRKKINFSKKKHKINPCSRKNFYKNLYGSNFKQEISRPQEYTYKSLSQDEEENLPEGLKSIIVEKSDKLKRKQSENIYNKLLKEREKLDYTEFISL